MGFAAASRLRRLAFSPDGDAAVLLGWVLVLAQLAFPLLAGAHYESHDSHDCRSPTSELAGITDDGADHHAPPDQTDHCFTCLLIATASHGAIISPPMVPAAPLPRAVAASAPSNAVALRTHLSADHPARAPPACLG